MKNKSERKIKTYMDKLGYGKEFTLEQAYKRLSPVGLEFKEGGTRLSIMLVYFSKFGWAGATNGYIMGFLPIEEQKESFGFQTNLDKHKTDKIDVTPDRIEITCDHKNDKSKKIKPIDVELYEPPEFFSVLPDLGECKENKEFNILKAELLKKLACGISDDSAIRILPESKEQLLILGEDGFGTLMCMVEDEFLVPNLK